MNNINSVKKEIEKIIEILMTDSISVDQNYPVIKNIKAKNKMQDLEWKDCKNLSISLRNIDYKDIYNEIDCNKDYSMKLLDGSIIQMLYRFQNKEIFSHRLAFFPSPTLLPFEEDAENYENDCIFADILDKNLVRFPLRFDYNKNDIESKHEHPRSHITLGQVKNCRIPAYGPISPIIFMEFILHNFYNTYYIDNNFYKRGKRQCKNLNSIRESEKDTLHFNIK